MIAVWIIAALLAWLGLGAFVTSEPAPRRARPAPQLELVRDQQLDIQPALDRRPR